MPEFTMLVETESGLQERKVARFEQKEGGSRPIPELRPGEFMLDTLRGDIKVIKIRETR